MIKKFALAIAIAAMTIGSAQAGLTTTGTVGFADVAGGSAGGSSAGDINTATVFGIGNAVTETNGTGVFLGLPNTFIGAISFDITSPTSLSFTNAVFGNFASTSIAEISNVAGAVGIYIVGNYIGGSYDPGSNGPGSLTISYTQTPAHSGAISDSGTFSIPPSPPTTSTPEPATVFGLISGVAAFAFIRLRRKTA